MARRILVVDDSDINRMMLRNILEREYGVLEAKNGQEALEMLEREQVDGILLDVMMPVMDGYAFLAHARKDARYRDLPVVVMTADNAVDSEIEALQLGAWDFVSKPFDPTILKFRLRNAIERSQLAAFQQIKKLAEMDSLTGIYNKRTFYLATAKLVKEHPDCEFVMLRFDIDNFKVYNDIFGVRAGDELLTAIGAKFRKMASSMMNTSYGYLEADHFAICMPKDAFDADTEIRQAREWLARLQPGFTFTPRFGACLFGGEDAEISQISDWALLALRSLKGKYNEYFRYYDASMRDTILEEQEIIGEMADALASDQFDVFLQPQYDLITGKLTGAEALVRWFHPAKGVVSPGKFIPIFERNGFISRLDEYIWERACQLLSRWKSAGLAPVPLSVNISRVDIYDPHLCKKLSDLLVKYDIAPSLLRLEITESAYTENPAQLIDVVHRLRKADFYMEMDDFGSGYSSLNSLKDVPVDLVKLDMKFLTSEGYKGRGSVVLTSIVSMLNSLELCVMAEGVETQIQADFLRSIGCQLVQGYLYARPMPVLEYEKLLAKDENAPKDEGASAS